MSKKSKRNISADKSNDETPELQRPNTILRKHVSENSLLLLIGFILTLPVILLYWSHYNSTPATPEMAPTGFVHGDMAYYVANARQYTDGMANGPLYANPYDVDPESPRIYFQPLILLWGLILHLSPIDPGSLLTFSTIVITIMAFTLFGKLYFTYQTHLGVKLHLFCLVFLAWGGGVLSLMGAAYSFSFGFPLDFFHFDPAGGWWFLNLGRNFSYPTEAFYHLITILIYYSVLTEKRRTLYVLIFFLAISHPFTGLQYTLIVFAWTLSERYVFQQKTYTLFDHAIVFLFLAGTLGYYLLFLPAFDAHRSLMQQWSLNWNLKLSTIIGAYGLVTFFVFSRFLKKSGWSALLSLPFNRFLLLCAIISFALANHELIMTPRQPIHFTRGHIWLPLCFLALPAISRALDHFRRLTSKTIGTGLMVCFCLVLLFDNLTFYYHCYTNHTGLALQKSYRAVFEFIDKKIDPHHRTVFISNDYYFAYMSATYTSASPLFGHFPNTPYQRLRLDQMKKIIGEGIVPPEFKDRRMLLAITPNNASFPLKQQCRKIYQNQDVSLFLYPKQSTDNIARSP